MAQRLSFERLSPYFESCDGDLERSIRLYEWNSAVSGALFEVLADVEVILRNAIHTTMTEWSISKGHGPDWYDNSHGLLGSRLEKHVARARARVEEQKRQVSPQRIVSELSFGFWRYLLTSKYRTTIWPILSNGAFSRVQVGYEEMFFARVGRVHDLRNRIAHHEPIHGRRIERDLLDCLRILSAICPETADWVQQRARVEAVLENRPL